MELLVIAIFVLGFELAALRWGYDSRDDFSSPPVDEFLVQRS